MSNRFAFGSDRQVMARLDAQEQRESQGFATRILMNGASRISRTISSLWIGSGRWNLAFFTSLTRTAS